MYIQKITLPNFHDWPNAMQKGLWMLCELNPLLPNLYLKSLFFFFSNYTIHDPYPRLVMTMMYITVQIRFTIVANAAYHPQCKCCDFTTILHAILIFKRHVALIWDFKDGGGTYWAWPWLYIWVIHVTLLCKHWPWLDRSSWCFVLSLNIDPTHSWPTDFYSRFALDRCSLSRSGRKTENKNPHQKNC